MSKYRRIRYEDRCQIYALSKRGASQESLVGRFNIDMGHSGLHLFRDD
jgi:hypothetical protein